MNSVGKTLERLVADPGHELGRWARFVRYQVSLWRFCARRLRQNNVMAMSAALSFRTIFALIPLLVLALLSVKSLGILEDARHALRRFLDASGFAQIAVLAEPDDATTMPGEMTEPQAGKIINVAHEIEKVVAGVESKLTFQRIGPVGGFLLIWTALTLLTTIERSLNRIFEAPRIRSLARRILIYWSVTTLGPLLLAVAVYLGRQLVDAFRGDSWIGWILVLCGKLGPIVVGVLVLSMAFALLPNTQVPFRAAFGGAVVAVPLWLLAKWGFSVYIERLVVSGNLYGVLGALPLFMFWLNLSWLIFLFGAELAHTAANLEGMELAEQAENIILGPSDFLATATAIAIAHDNGEGPVALSDVASRLRLPADSVSRLVNLLADAGILCAVVNAREGTYALARAPTTIRLLDILEVADPRLKTSPMESYGVEIAEAVGQVQTRTKTSLEDMSLADLLHSPEGTHADVHTYA